MTFKTIITSAFIATLCATSVFAQDSATNDTTTNNAAPKDGQAMTYEDLPDGGLYFRDNFGDWRMRCQKNPDANDECVLYQLLKDDKGGVVAQISVFNFPNASGAAVAGANVTVPLETALREDLRIRIDDKQAKGYPFSYCDKVGCHARLGFTAVEIKWMQDGSIARLASVPYHGDKTPVIVDISLKGFTAGYKAIVENNKP